METLHKKRVAILSPALDAVSGFSTHVNMLFDSPLQRDFDLIHFQVGSEGRRETVWQKLWRAISSPAALALFLVRRRPDIVHINTCLAPKAYWRDLAYFLVARVMGRRIVNQIHGGALPQEFFRGKRLPTWLLKRVLLASHVVTVLSTDELIAYQQFDSRINVHLVPNAIQAGGDLFGARSFNTNEPLRLLYVGRLIRSKGLFETIDALTRLTRDGREYVLRIAGDGTDGEKLRAAVHGSALDNSVEFLGPVFGLAKDRLWLESDVFVFPTYHTEGLPYAILEAMAAGCVPVTCRVAAIPDVITDGVDGLLIPQKDADALADALIRLDIDRPSLVRMAKAGRKRVEQNYTTERLAGDFSRLYTSA